MEADDRSASGRLQHRAADLLGHDLGPGLQDQPGEFGVFELGDIDFAPMNGRHREFAEGLGADFEQQLLVTALKLQDHTAVERQREGLLADVEPGVAAVGDLVGAREGEGEAAEVFDGWDDPASLSVYSAAARAWASSPNTRANTRSTFLKW